MAKIERETVHTPFDAATAPFPAKDALCPNLSPTWFLFLDLSIPFSLSN